MQCKANSRPHTFPFQGDPKPSTKILLHADLSAIDNFFVIIAHNHRTLLFGLSGQSQERPKQPPAQGRGPECPQTYCRKDFPIFRSALIYAKLFSGVWHHQELPWWERTI